MVRMFWEQRFYKNVPNDAYVSWISEDKSYGMFNVVLNSSKFQEIGDNVEIPKVDFDDYKVLFPDH